MSELSGTGLGPKHRRLTQLAGVYYDYSIVNYFVQLPASLGILAVGVNGIRAAGCFGEVTLVTDKETETWPDSFLALLKV